MASTNNGYELYHYTPSIVAAAHFIVIFALLTTLHTYRMIKNRLWFCIPFTIGGIFESIGYIGRAIGHSSPESLPPYIVQSLFILLAPALFAASIYMTLGRLIRATHAESLSLIRVTWLTKCFVAGDVLTFFIQGGGGGIMASHDPSKVKLGQNVILGSLFLQLFIFGLFVVVSIIFHLRLRKQPTREESVGRELRWERMMGVLYVVSALIMVRNIFRVVEYLGGREGPLLRVEWTIYVFDAVFMAVTMVVWWIWYPVSVRPEESLTGDTEAGVDLAKTEILLDGRVYQGKRARS